SVTAEELTQCAYFDLRVTRDGRHPKEVAELILHNRANSVCYEHKYQQLWNENKQSFPSKGDVYRYAGDILDYMVLANLLQHKGTGYYYYLNVENKEAISYHLQHNVWFRRYEQFYDAGVVSISEIAQLE